MGFRIDLMVPLDVFGRAADRNAGSEMTPGSQTIYANPFRTWAELLRGLRQCFVVEAGLVDNAALLTPLVGEALGTITTLTTYSKAIEKQINALQRKVL